jgi:hypothetical protein
MQPSATTAGAHRARQGDEERVEFGHGHARHRQGQAEQGDPGQAEQHAAGFAPAVVERRGQGRGKGLCHAGSWGVVVA